ncbi:hypothetical protein TNCV_427721 [Trichonephila clavipes]|nr:hypothetical protein TNCV_427721 [Trichonephila clavipes]
MVWGAIAYDSRSTLIVMRGTLTGQRYVDDILRPHILGEPHYLEKIRSSPHPGKVSPPLVKKLRSRTRGWRVASSIPGATEDPSCRGSRCMLNLSDLMSSRLRGVVVWRGRYQLKCHPHH